MKLYLLRHGETQENIEGTVQGWLDTELNKTGIEQAKNASQMFNEPIVAIYSSDLKRCVLTAVNFRQSYPEIPYFEDKRLRERNFGDAQGTHRDLHDWEVFWSSKDEVSINNAETLNEYSKRVAGFLEEIKTIHKNNEKILIVTHGGTIRRILDVTGINNDYAPVGNCEAIMIDLI